MSRAGRILFIFGVFVSLLSGFAVFVLMANSQPRPQEVPTTKVVIAYQYIGARTEITAEQVGVANWPRALPTPMGAVEEPKSVVGRFAIAPIPPGQAVIAEAVLSKDDVKETHSNAALLITKGKVAVALPVTTKSNVADAIQPGDRVDVIASFRSPSGGGGAANAVATHRLLPDVLVMNVGLWPTGTSKEKQAAGSGILTLELTEQDADVLIYAQEFASSITLVLRPANDHDLVTLEPVTFDYVNRRFGYNLPR